MPFFDIFASPRWPPLRMRTKVASFFIFFQELSNKKKIKALRPKMTKIASRGGPALTQCHVLFLLSKTNHSPLVPALLRSRKVHHLLFFVCSLKLVMEMAYTAHHFRTPSRSATGSHMPPNSITSLRCCARKSPSSQSSEKTRFCRAA